MFIKTDIFKEKCFVCSFKSTFQRFVHELSLTQMTTAFPTNTSPSTMNEYSVSHEEIPSPRMISLSSQLRPVSTQRNAAILQGLDATQNQKRKHSPEKAKQDEKLVKKSKPATAIPSNSSLGKN